MEIGSNSSTYWQVGYAAPGSLQESQLERATMEGDAIHLSQEDNGDKDFKRKLSTRYKSVKSHEAAHLAAAVGLARGGVNYTYQTGPDGQQHAVGGHVNIDMGKESTPEATIAKMQQVIAAAKAPSDPSNQDVAVAMAASQTLQEAREELADKRRSEKDGKSSTKIKIETAYKGGQSSQTFSAHA